MAIALEAIKRPARVRLVRSVHQQHTPDPIAVVDPQNPGPAVKAIRDHVLKTQRKGAGSYLFIDDARQVFVLSELQSVTSKWLQVHFAWLVAFYAPRRRDGNKKNPDGTAYLTASLAGIAEDIGQHLADSAAVAA